MAAKKAKKDLSKRQESILLFIEERIVSGFPPPSIREICEECNVSSTSVADYNLKRLEALGYIDRTNRVSRGIQVIRPIGAMRDNLKEIRVPLWGTIAAGDPIEPPENDFPPEEELIIPHKLLGDGAHGKNLFALRVKGESMVDALVGDGDIVVMAPQENAEKGQMVAAWIPSKDMWTLKKYYPHDDGKKIELRPANRAAYSDDDIKEKFTFDATDVRISGRVHMVYRQV